MQTLAWPTVDEMAKDVSFRDLIQDGLGFIYALCDPETDEVRYIGQTVVSPTLRLKQHLGRARRGGQEYASRWMRTLLESTSAPVMRIVTIVPREYLDDSEIGWIAHLRDAGCRLTNTTIGGSTMGYGEDHPSSIRTSAEVLAIRERFAAGESRRALAEEFGTVQGSIDSIITGKLWATVGGPIHETAPVPHLTAEERLLIWFLRTCGYSVEDTAELTGRSHWAVTSVISTGRRLGKDHPHSVLTVELVTECRRRCRNGESGAELAREFGVDIATMCRAIKGTTWAHVAEPPVTSRRRGNAHTKSGRRLLSAEQVVEVERRILNGEKSGVIATAFSVSRPYITNIKRDLRRNAA